MKLVRHHRAVTGSVRLVALMTVALAATSDPLIVAQRESTPLAFEVVSIRRAAEPRFTLSQVAERSLRIMPSGQLVGTADLRTIIHIAYGVEPYERVIAKDPRASRLLDQQFEIRALPPRSAPTSDHEVVRAMTRQLLMDRFGADIRVDSEFANAIVFRVIKPGTLGSGIRPAPAGCTQLPADARPGDVKFAEAYVRNCRLTFFEDRVRGTVTLDDFARALSGTTRRLIVNRCSVFAET
jgi:uncharacterized protein (TIGR03435 family)